MKKDLRIRFPSEDSLEEMAKLKKVIEISFTGTINTPPASLIDLKPNDDFEIEKLESISGDDLLEQLSKAFSERFIFLFKDFEEHVKDRREAGEFIPMIEFRDFLVERKKNKDSDVVDELINLTTNGDLLSMNPPASFIMPKTKAMNTLINPALTPVDGESSVEFTVQNGSATLKMALDFDNNIEIQSRDHMRFTPYDREVFNGICSRYENDNDTFTAEQIYRTINGLSNRETVSEASIKRINDSITKMIRMRVKIDYTEEMKKYKKSDDVQEDDVQYIQEDYMIPAKKASLTVNNKTIEGYKLHAKPLMYHYSQISNQIITVPLEILNTKDGTNDSDSINNSPEITVIRAHLIREIEWIKAEMKKKNPNRNNKISLESVYELLELESPTKKKALKIRDHISKILNNFISKNYIKSYDTYKKGRTIMGFQLVL
ncbi:hypothetical protein ACFSY7_11240 [Kurthia populi]|uniref:Transcriptional regulator n=1 Tax=Kurthia populi TaxID=1562132 RepID=A0ABW5Y181_9BACL